MSIICIGSVKGGAGKTTIATNIAAAMAPQHDSYLLVDADPQATATGWVCKRDKGDKPPVDSVQTLGDGVQHTINKLHKKHPNILIDAGGRDSNEFRGALLAADRVYVPLVPSQFDVNSLDQTLLLIRGAQGFNKKLRAYIVLNQVATHPGTMHRIEKLLPILEDYKEFAICDAIIHHRVIYKDAASEGLGVVEYGQPENKSRQEMWNLIQEIHSHDVQ